MERDPPEMRLDWLDIDSVPCRSQKLMYDVIVMTAMSAYVGFTTSTFLEFRPHMKHDHLCRHVLHRNHLNHHKMQQNLLISTMTTIITT